MRELLPLLLIALLAAACGDDGSTADGGGAGNNGSASNNGGGNNGGTNNGDDNNGLLNNGLLNNGVLNNGTADNNGATNNGATNNGGPANNGADDPRNIQLIRSAPYPKLVIEIDAAPGKAPRQGAIDQVVGVLGDLLDKPGGVEVVTDGQLEARGADHAWEFSAVDALADETFDLQTGPDAIKIHLLYVDGHSASDSDGGKVLGQAWAWTHLVMYKDTIDDLCARNAPPLVGESFCVSAEASILLHEIGHLLGLVDNGLPMVTDHRDPDHDHGRHDANPDCIMYWAFEGEGLFDSLAEQFLGGNESAKTFDQACLDDIAAVR